MEQGNAFSAEEGDIFPDEFPATAAAGTPMFDMLHSPAPAGDPEEELEPICDTNRTVKVPVQVPSTKNKDNHPLLQQDNGEEAEADEEALLTEDAYSLLYVSKFGSQTSIVAGFSICLQGGMLLVTFLDLFDTSSEGNDTNGSTNRMEVPSGSTLEVMIAQFFGMLITAMLMAADGDLVIGITQIIKGYDPRIQQQCPNATWLRWLLTGLLQSFFGVLLLLNSFILSMQSASVIDLSLNLTALHFIQEFDEMAFKLGANSKLLGPQVEANCKNVRNIKGYSTPAQRKRNLFRRRALIALMTIGLLIPYFIVVFRQADGHWICKNLYIQFGDAYIPHMAHYGGHFKSQGNSLRMRRGQRNFYVDATGTYKVSFCNAESFWAVSELQGNECEDFLYRSQETETFDIVEAADLNWFVSTEFTGLIDADWIKIVCRDCNEDTCPSERGYCSEDKEHCICKEDEVGNRRFGLNCQLEEQCVGFGLDQRTRDGLSTISGASRILDQEYVSLSWNDTRFFGFPVYTPFDATTWDFFDEIDSFIIYTGRRWVLYAIPDHNLAAVVEANGMPSNWSLTDFILYFDELNNEDIYPTSVDALKKLTSELYNYMPIFFSSPLNFGENSFGVDPGSVTWVQASSPYNLSNPLIPATPNEGQPVAAKLICSACGEEGERSCLNGGYCVADFCICPVPYLGLRCERIKDCVGYGGCNGFGTCNEEGVCDCEEGSFGSLCQLGEGAQAVQDPFLCNECRILGWGKCKDPLVPECTCFDGYTGVYCNETMETDSPTSNWEDANSSFVSPGNKRSLHWPKKGSPGTASPGTA